MSELDEAWAFALAEAEARARLAGHVDIAAYLSLRNSNDLLRSTGIDWLMTTCENLAGEANRRGASIQIEKDDKHRFQVGNDTMVGRILTLTNGVRKLFIEAGWPRMPRDGVVRGSGLARGNLRHFGASSANEALLLVLSPKGIPRWVSAEPKGPQAEIHESELRKHITLSWAINSLGFRRCEFNLPNPKLADPKPKVVTRNPKPETCPANDFRNLYTFSNLHQFPTQSFRRKTASFQAR